MNIVDRTLCKIISTKWVSTTHWNLQIYRFIFYLFGSLSSTLIYFFIFLNITLYIIFFFNHAYNKISSYFLWVSLVALHCSEFALHEQYFSYSVQCKGIKLGSADFHKLNQNNCGLTKSFHRPACDNNNPNRFVLCEALCGKCEDQVLVFILRSGSAMTSVHIFVTWWNLGFIV